MSVDRDRTPEPEADIGVLSEIDSNILVSARKTTTPKTTTLHSPIAQSPVQSPLATNGVFSPLSVVAGSTRSITPAAPIIDSTTELTEAGSKMSDLPEPTNFKVVISKPTINDIDEVLTSAKTLRFALTPESSDLEVSHVDATKIFESELAIMQCNESLSPTITTRTAPGVFNSKEVMDVNFVPRNSRLQQLDPMEYAQYIWDKYIKTDSEFEINVPWRTKSALKKYFDNPNARKLKETDPLQYAKDMFVLFDKSWTDIHQMISVDSFTRFQQTKEFEIVLKNWERLNGNPPRTARTRSVSAIKGMARMIGKAIRKTTADGHTDGESEREIERESDRDGDRHPETMAVPLPTHVAVESNSILGPLESE